MLYVQFTVPSLIVPVAVAVGILAAYHFDFSFNYVIGSIYAVTSALAFAWIREEKQLALHSKKRIPEDLLHIVEACGGFAGSFLTRRLYRHKIFKAVYQIVFWAIVSMHIIG